MTDLLIDFLEKSKMLYLLSEPMCDHTTFRIGGRAKYYITPSCEDELSALISFLKASDIKYFICGRLSNVVFSDCGFDGAVIDLRRLSEVCYDGEHVTCGAGVSLTSLAYSCAKKGLSGLEFAYGIPGTVGGGIFMNAGAYGGQISDVVVSVRALDPVSGDIVTLSHYECNFDYRHSIFTTSSFIILSASFRLDRADPTLCVCLCEDNMRKRKDKQPLDKPSAGSVFKRPDGHFVGSMIEDLGLKGLRVGGVSVSCKHAGFMVNDGGGCCSDLLSLIDIVRKKVFDHFGVMLECEIRFV